MTERECFRYWVDSSADSGGVVADCAHTEGAMMEVVVAGRQAAIQAMRVDDDTVTPVVPELDILFGVTMVAVCDDVGQRSPGMPRVTSTAAPPSRNNLRPATPCRRNIVMSAIFDVVDCDDTMSPCQSSQGASGRSAGRPRPRRRSSIATAQVGTDRARQPGEQHDQDDPADSSGPPR